MDEIDCKLNVISQVYSITSTLHWPEVIAAQMMIPSADAPSLCFIVCFFCIHTHFLSLLSFLCSREWNNEKKRESAATTQAIIFSPLKMIEAWRVVAPIKGNGKGSLPTRRKRFSNIEFQFWLTERNRRKSAEPCVKRVSWHFETSEPVEKRSRFSRDSRHHVKCNITTHRRRVIKMWSVNMQSDHRQLITEHHRTGNVNCSAVKVILAPYRFNYITS